MKSSLYSDSQQALCSNAGIPVSAEKGEHFYTWPNQRSALF